MLRFGKDWKIYPGLPGLSAHAVLEERVRCIWFLQRPQSPFFELSVAFASLFHLGHDTHIAHFAPKCEPLKFVPCFNELSQHRASPEVQGHRPACFLNVRQKKLDRVAEDIMLNFSESGHTVFLGSSALERGDLESKGKGKLFIHFCVDDNTAELVRRTIISVNQLSIYGAVADMRDELACRISGCSESTRKPVAQDNPETTFTLIELMTTNKSPRASVTVEEACWAITSENRKSSTSSDA